MSFRRPTTAPGDRRTFSACHCFNVSRDQSVQCIPASVDGGIALALTLRALDKPGALGDRG
jgi:hypothetical protein